MLNYKSIISHSFDRIDPPIIVLVVISLSLRIKQIELCYMNKTNISWLRDNRELYLIEIEIKRGPCSVRTVHIGVAQAPNVAAHAPHTARIGGERGPQPWIFRYLSCLIKE